MILGPYEKYHFGAGPPSTKSLIKYVANIDSYYVGFFIISRSYVCGILGLYHVLKYVSRLYWFLMSMFFSKTEILCT